MMRGLKWKLENSFWCLVDIILLFPKRVFWLIQHLYSPVAPIYLEAFPRTYRLFWGLEVVLRLLEIIGVGDVYNMLSAWFKFNTRPLSESEHALLETIFGKDFPWHRVGIDEWAVMGPPQSQICYVSFWTINSWRRMSDCLLVHEMVHTWQYHHLGIVYIPRALVAQRTIWGYDYGGVEALQKVYRKQGKLQHFNLEQQADIVADYCRIKKGLGPSWGKGSWIDLPLYQYFIDQLI